MDIGDWHEGNVIVNGIKLHYYRAGTGPSIVLSHGVTDSGLNWTAVGRVLKDRFDVIMWDQRGHGDSDAPEGPVYDGQHRASDLAGLVEALNLDRPLLMGHSMGGETTALCAALYPDISRGIVLEDPSIFVTMGNEKEITRRKEAMRDEILRRRASTKAELIEEARTKVHPGWPDEEYEFWAEAKLKVSPFIVSRFTQQKSPWQDIVSKIRCPVLLIGGDPSVGHVIVTEDFANQSSEIWKTNDVDHQISFISGAGHNIRRDRYDDFMAVVEPWLDTHV